MTDPHPHGHEHRHSHGPPWSGGGWSGGKPPWWPDDEAWPPSGPEAWRGMRRRFLRRFAIVLAAIVAIVAVLAAIVGRSAGGPGGHPSDGPPFFFFPFWIVVLLVIVVLVVRAGRRFADPLADVMEAADRVAGGDYATRVDERGPDEVRRLSRAFNEMTERLGSNEDRRRRLLSDVAHELRTPLSVIQANVEALLDGVYPADPEHLGRVLEETKVMSRLLDDLQTLSTAEAGALKLHRERVAPDDLVEAAVGSFAARASESGVTLRAEVEDVPEIEVDPVRIGEVLSNLLSNAVRHTPDGGAIVVSASSTPDGVELTVRDTGPGIAPDQLPHVFDRFSKAPDSPGAGLGLAIAKSLVEAHGGTIHADSGPSGTTITVSLRR